MKSSDIKNWSYVLTPQKIKELDDYGELRLWAVLEGACLSCGGTTLHNVEVNGFCRECVHSGELTKEEFAEQKAIGDFIVKLLSKKSKEIIIK